MIIRIGTRESQLAIAQTLIVEQLLKEHFSTIKTQIIKIRTTGDIILNKPLSEIGGKGLFIKEIEKALLTEKVDIAVHSMKDIPVVYSNKLVIPCILKRESPYDAFISLNYNNIDSLPKGSIVGTSSIRRKVQLLCIRPDLKVLPLRGNIDSRLKKVLLNEFDAIVLAEAGLKRINKSNMIKQILTPKIMLSAVGQGGIGIQCRNNDNIILAMLKSLNHQKSSLAISAERYFMQAVNGSCTTPLAALAQYIDDKKLTMTCMLANDKKMEFLQYVFDESSIKKVSLNLGYQLKNKLKN